MRPALAVVLGSILATPLAASADVLRLANGEAISGIIRSCQGGEVVVEPPAARPVLVKMADISSGEGPDIERCLRGGKSASDDARSRWYGGEILVAEIGSFLLLPVAGGIRSGLLADLAVSGILLSPAILHAVHGNLGRAFGSAGIHLGLAVGGAFLGAAIASCGVGEDCFLKSLGGAALGALASQAIATTIDVWSFAYQPAPAEVAIGVLLRDSPRGLTGSRTLPAGLQFALRF